jgi:hypothetical protein
VNKHRFIPIYTGISTLYSGSNSPQSEWLSSRKKITNVEKDSGKGGSLYTVGENVN